MCFHSLDDEIRNRKNDDDKAAHEPSLEAHEGKGCQGERMADTSSKARELTRCCNVLGVNYQ